MINIERKLAVWLHNLITDEIRSSLLKKGWVTFDWDGAQADLLKLAKELGEPIPSRKAGNLVDRLIPTTAEQAHIRSMSSLFGEGAFPFHTDAAYLRVPPRFVILRHAEGESVSRPTLLLDSQSLPLASHALNVLRREVWLVNGGRGRFYTPILNETLVPGTTIARFDRNCMKPVGDEASCSLEILENMLASAEPRSISWSKSQVLIVDNWKILHARGPKPFEETESRILERVLVT